MPRVRSAIARSALMTAALGFLFTGSLDAAQNAEQSTPMDARLQKLDESMPLGPRSARSLGLRVDWREPIDSKDCRGVFVSGGMVFVISSNNEITCYDTSNGQLLWRGFGGNPTDSIIDVRRVNQNNHVLIVRASSILTLSALTGIPVMNDASQSSVQSFEWLASTPGVVVEDKYVYGGLGGEVVWQNWKIGFPAEANRIGRKIVSGPVAHSNVLVAGARDGTIAAFNSRNGIGLWQKKLLGSPVGLPSTGGGKVFVASDDQHLRALDIHEGNLEWSYLFKRSLKHGPALVGNSVYQAVPDEGLYRLEASPKNPIDGVVLWTAPEVVGQVVGHSGELLLVWDQESKTFTTVSKATGSVDTKVQSHGVDHAAMDGSTIVLIGNGELECVVPAGSR